MNVLTLEDGHQWVLPKRNYRHALLNILKKKTQISVYSQFHILILYYHLGIFARSRDTS